MTTYILRRLAWAVPTALVVSLIIFSLLYITPGDPAAMMAGQDATPEEIETLRSGLKLDRPFHVRLGEFYWDLAHLDLGDSIRTGDPVIKLIASRLDVTLTLALLVEGVILGIGIPLGVIAAWRQNTWIDRGVMVVAVLGFSIPGFWLAFMAMWLFSLKLGVLPAAGYVPFGEGAWPFFERLILPTAVTGLIGMALLVRMTRGAMVELLREDFVRTARAKGLGERVVLFRHALKAAAPPIITVVGLGFAGLVTGLVITESVFALPGLGLLLASAIAARDYPVIQGFILLVSLVYVVVNLLVDISYAALDPRVRL